MNYYYNPYFYSIPNMGPRLGLFSRLFGGRNFSFSGLLSGTQKTLNTINQIIPLAKQAKPLVNNVKTMFKVMNEFKKVNIPQQSIYEDYNNLGKEKTQQNESYKNSNNGPTFFL